MNLFKKHNEINMPKDIILLLSNESMQILFWLDKKFCHFGPFKENDDDINKFAQCILTFPGVPITLIVDYIGEYFRHEMIAHVNRRDRKHLLERKLNHYFRASQFRNAKVISNERNVRKEDKVLLMSLTNTEIILPWVNVLIENRAPIKCISSVSFLMENLCIFNNLKKVKHLLIVNVEPKGDFRQTYLENGNVLFSRKNPILTQSKGRIALAIETQCNQSKSYLERIKLLPLESLLEVHIFSSYGKCQDFDLNSHNTENITFTQYYTPDLASSLNLVYIKGRTGAAELTIAKTFSSSKKKTNLENIYCPPIFKKYFILDKYKRNLTFASYAILLLTFIMLIPLVKTGLDNNNTIDRTYLKTMTLRNEHFTSKNINESTPIEPVKMELIVNNYDHYSSQHSSPKHIIFIISNALGENSEINLTSFNWETIAVSNDEFEGEDYDESDLSSEYTTNISTIINGVVKLNGDYLQAQNHVNKFIETLKNNTFIKVTPLIMPMDTSADAPVTITLNDDRNKTNFSLQLLYDKKNENRIRI